MNNSALMQALQSRYSGQLSGKPYGDLSIRNSPDDLIDRLKGVYNGAWNKMGDLASNVGEATAGGVKLSFPSQEAALAAYGAYKTPGEAALALRAMRKTHGAEAPSPEENDLEDVKKIASNL